MRPPCAAGGAIERSLPIEQIESEAVARLGGRRYLGRESGIEDADHRSNRAVRQDSVIRERIARFRPGG